jgi:HNH endonuclease
MEKGYVLVLVDEDDAIARPMASKQGYVPEHRLVVARALGRTLLPTEQVHHINGQKTDNRLANLELRTKPHGPGVALECRSCGSRDVRAVPLHGIESTLPAVRLPS